MPRRNCGTRSAFSSRSRACSNNSRAVLRSSSDRRCCASASANNSSAPARRSSARKRLVATCGFESAPTRSSIGRIVTAVPRTGRPGLWKTRQTACTLDSPNRGKPRFARLNFTLFAGAMGARLWKVVVGEARDPSRWRGRRAAMAMPRHRDSEASMSAAAGDGAVGAPPPSSSEAHGPDRHRLDRHRGLGRTARPFRSKSSPRLR